jgi:hypothetical protein
MIQLSGSGNKKSWQNILAIKIAHGRLKAEERQ